MKQTTLAQAGDEAPAWTALLLALLACGIIAPVLHVAIDIVAAMQLEGYSYIDSMVSELSAVGASTRPLVTSSSIAHGALLLAFGMGVWRSAGKRRDLRITAVFLVVYGVIGLIGWLFPMNPRGAERSATDIGHLALIGATVVSILGFVGFGSGAKGQGFRVYSVATVLAVLALGAISARHGPQIAAGASTPWAGLIERISFYGPYIWIVAFASVLLLVQKGRRGNGEAADERAAE